MSGAAARLAAFVALAVLAMVQWATLLAPAAPVRQLGCVAVAIAAAEAVRRAARAVLRALAAAGAVLAMLLVAGVPFAMLDPEAWGALASGLGQGIEALPTLGVPYRGVDPWIRTVLIAAGGVLVLLAALLAVRALRRDARPLGAALALATAFAIPVVVHNPDSALLWGALFTVLLGAVLWGDRIERAHVPASLAFVAVALGAGLVVAPRVEADEPWIDYEEIVQSLSTPPSVGFQWDHGYGPLDWPRENRVMLRVAAGNPTYWKATDLEAFDGFRWVSREIPPAVLTEFAPNHADWRRDLRVTVRDLESPLYITAGTGLSIRDSPLAALLAGPGTFSTGDEPLRRGDTYLAEVYTPNPSVRELRNAGTRYPGFVTPYLTLELPVEVGGPSLLERGAPSALGPASVRFPEFSVLSARTPPAGALPTGDRVANASPWLAESAYAEVHALARRMRERSDTPYEYVREVQALLAGEGFRYTEDPPRPRPGEPPLTAFVLRDRAGYCQQFSGAMALLLRMGGVPARVSAGFSPGSFDEDRDEWVVRDVDAHSWVEAYFPGLGWITFDPTPGVAPPRTQLLNGPAPLDAETIPLRDDPRRADVPAPGADAAAGDDGGGGLSVWLAVPLALLAGAAVAGGIALAAGRRGATPQDDLAELQRALRVTGREADPSLTLRALEDRFRHAPDAAAYVAAVRVARFAGRAVRPTGRQRAALRSELAAGLGLQGRLRAWFALPPGLQ